MTHQQQGFTMVELVAVLVILGIIAVVVLPESLSLGATSQQAAFHDRTVALLRYGQKTATSHRRRVCVDFTATTLTLTIDNDNNGTCDGQALNFPAENGNILTAPANTTFDPLPGNIVFLPDGSGADRNVQITGQPLIQVAGATGYVR